MIDFSRYNFWFEDFCREYSITFKSQKKPTAIIVYGLKDSIMRLMFIINIHLT